LVYKKCDPDGIPFLQRSPTTLQLV